MTTTKKDSDERDDVECAGCGKAKPAGRYACTECVPAPTEERGEGEVPMFVECAPCATRPGAPTLCAACRANRRSIDRLTADLAAARARLADYEDERRAVMEERCQDEMHCPCVPTLRREVTAARAEVERLTDEHRAHVRMRRVAEEERDALRADVERLTREVDDARRTLAHVEAVLPDEAAAMNEPTAAQVSRLRTRAVNAEAARDAVIKERDEARAGYAAVLAKGGSLLAERDALAAKVADAEARAATLAEWVKEVGEIRDAQRTRTAAIVEAARALVDGRAWMRPLDDGENRWSALVPGLEHGVPNPSQSWPNLDADLVAASPDLLAACRALLEVIADVPGYDPYGSTAWCDAKAKAEEQARAAITKATGGIDG